MSTMSETGNQMGFPIARKVGPAFVAMEPYHAENLTAGSRGNTSTRRQRPRRRNLAAKQIPLRLGSRWHFIPIPKTARADGARATHFVPSGPNPYSVAFVPSTLSAPMVAFGLLRALRSGPNRAKVPLGTVLYWCAKCAADTMDAGRPHQAPLPPLKHPPDGPKLPLGAKFGGNLSNV